MATGLGLPFLQLHHKLVFTSRPRLNVRALKPRLATADTRPASRAYLLFALFFCSGATSLGYEVLWFKRFAHLWGSSALALAFVVASFLLGLGLGASLIGRWADRCRSPLLCYGWCEAGIGVLALLVPLEIAGLGGVNSWVYAHLHRFEFLHALARGLLTFLVIGPPCALMGGTLPLLVKQAAPDQEQAAHSTAWLYGINTAGAAVGCLAAGFWLIPALGLWWTNLAAVAANAAIAVVAMRMARQDASNSGPVSASPATSAPPGRQALHPGGSTWP